MLFERVDEFGHAPVTRARISLPNSSLKEVECGPRACGFAGGYARSRPFVGLVKIAVAQPVARIRDLRGTQVGTTSIYHMADFDAKNVMYAETWHTPRPLNVKDIQGIVGVADNLMRDFENDCLKAK